MDVKRGELIEIMEIITEMLKESKKVKLNMKLNSNFDSFSEEIERLKKSIKISDKYKEFENKRLELCKLYCDKDENDKPILVDNNFVGLLNNEKFNEKIDELKITYKDDINDFEEQIKDYKDLLSEIVDIEVSTFSSDLIPDDLIDGIKLRKIKILLED